MRLPPFAMKTLFTALLSLSALPLAQAAESTPADEKPWMMPMAYISLAVFVSAMTFLGFALKWPKLTTRFAVKMTLLDRFASADADGRNSIRDLMVRIFQELGQEHPVASSFRRRLAAAMY